MNWKEKAAEKLSAKDERFPILMLLSELADDKAQVQISISKLHQQLVERVEPRANGAQLSKRTVQSWLRKLEALELIKVSYDQPAPGTRIKPNRYQLKF